MQYFTIDELLKHRTDDPQMAENATVLAEKFLDPIRERLGKPIVISSCYRTPTGNGACNGAKKSQHLTAQAADIYGPTKEDTVAIFRIAMEIGGFDQLIWEKPGRSAWVHISYANPNYKQNPRNYQRGDVYAMLDPNYRIYTNIKNTWQDVVK